MERIVFTARDTFITDYLNLIEQSTGLDGDILIDKTKVKNSHTTLIGIINFSIQI